MSTTIGVYKTSAPLLVGRPPWVFAAGTEMQSEIWIESEETYADNFEIQLLT